MQGCYTRWRLVLAKPEAAFERFDPVPYAPTRDERIRERGVLGIYAQESPGVHRGYEYAPTRNPTREALERCVADLENGTTGFAFASGSAAVATVLECQVSHVIATDDLYGGTLRLFERVRRRSAGIRLTRVDMSDPKALEAAIRPETRLIWVETPTNPMLKLVDLATIGAIGQGHGIWSGADNTFASPYVQRPLDHGFSVVIHSTTKYLNGHSDVIGGMGSDAQISSPDALGNPVIGGICAIPHEDHAHIRLSRWLDRSRAVGDDENMNPEARSHTIDFLSHQARIGIDANLWQRPDRFPIKALVRFIKPAAKL